MSICRLRRAISSNRCPLVSTFFLLLLRQGANRVDEGVDEYFIMTDNKNKNKRNRVSFFFFFLVAWFVLMRWALAMIFDDATCAFV